MGKSGSKLGTTGKLVKLCKTFKKCLQNNVLDWCCSPLGGIHQKDLQKRTLYLCCCTEIQYNIFELLYPFGYCPKKQRLGRGTRQFLISPLSKISWKYA